MSDYYDQTVIDAICGMKAEPLKYCFGLNRGTAIDRIYIEKYLKSKSDLIYGECIEIAENTYTKKYGGAKVKHSYIMHYTGENGNLQADLVTGEGIQEEFVDCAIITQTLMFVTDVRKAASNIRKMLRVGGSALLTVSGISPVSVYDRDRWGHFYSFYEDGIREIFEPVFGHDNVEITIYGNAKTALGFIYGLAAQDFEEDDFLITDDAFPVIYGITLHR